MAIATYTLRPATEADLAFLFDLHRATMQRYVEQVWGWDDAAQERRFRDRFDPARYRIVGVDGRDVGALSVEDRDDCVFLGDIKIRPDHQRRGLGSAIVGDVIADARQRAQPVTLQVLKVNPARRLYERLGFAIIGETPTHYLMRTR